MRIAPPETADSASPLTGFVPIKNRPPANSEWAASQIVSADALALVRFGLRSADDPRITKTVRVIDALLRTEVPQGPLWRRYNEDGYGEHEDGRPFDGTGIGDSGRCSRASEPITSSRPAEPGAPARCCARSRRAQATAACCRSRSGMATTFPNASCLSVAPPDRRCRWYGRTRST